MQLASNFWSWISSPLKAVGATFFGQETYRDDAQKTGRNLLEEAIREDKDMLTMIMMMMMMVVVVAAVVGVMGWCVVEARVRKCRHKPDFQIN
jgi:heme/copper-type cytochrome/quinol oxidase subunit 2